MMDVLWCPSGQGDHRLRHKDEKNKKKTDLNRL